MKIKFVTGRGAPPRAAHSQNLFSGRFGAWGTVQAVHSDHHAVDVYMDTGTFIEYVPVSSKEWVKKNDDYTSGERDLPPEEARVFVMMPTGTLDGCFVLCSGFTTLDQGHRDSFMPEEKEKERFRVTPGNWKETYQYENGSYKIVSPDEETSAELDYSGDDPTLKLTLFEKIKLTITSITSFLLSFFDDEVIVDHKSGDSIKITAYDSDITIKEGEITINAKKTTVNVTGDCSLTATGKVEVTSSVSADVTAPKVSVIAASSADIDSPAVTIKSAATVISGGTLKNDGTAAPTGKGPFCATPVCPFGFPHVGNVATGG
ncbi:hypothetical protein FACS189447_03410 [Spirochaetia bacterium]|nr:hypothetical protein FACS189447_03410 [Spirochaetia bacterium]